MILEQTQTTTGNPNLTQTTFDYRETCRRGVFLPVVFIDINDGMNTDAQIFAQIVYWHEPDSNGNSRLKFFEDGRLWLMKYHGQWFNEIRIKKATARKVLKRLEKRGLIHYKSDSENTDKPLMAINWAEFKRRLKIWADNGGDKATEKKYSQLMALYENLEPLPDEPPPPTVEPITIHPVSQAHTKSSKRSAMGELWDAWEKETETLTYDDLLEERKRAYLNSTNNTPMPQSPIGDPITSPAIQSQQTIHENPVTKSQGVLPDNIPSVTKSQEGVTQSQHTPLPDDRGVLPDNSTYIEIKEKKEKEIHDKQTAPMISLSKNSNSKPEADASNINPQSSQNTDSKPEKDASDVKPNLSQNSDSKPETNTSNINPEPSKEIMVAIRRVFNGNDRVDKNIYIMLTGCIDSPKLRDTVWYEFRLKNPVTAHEIYMFETWYKINFGSDIENLHNPTMLVGMFKMFRDATTSTEKSPSSVASV